MATATQKKPVDEFEQIRNTLAQLAGKAIAQDEVTLEFPKTAPVTVAAAERRIGKPEEMSPEQMVEVLNEHIADQKQEAMIHQEFNARFDEVVVAMHRVFRATFGTGGRGKKIETMFGQMPPQTANFTVGLDSRGRRVSETNVPVSPFTFAPLGPGATVHPGTWNHPQYGTLGKVTFQVRKFNSPVVDGLIKLIQQELDANSIYKGQILDLSKGGMHAEYDLRHRYVQTDEHLVYNEDVARDLAYEVWGKMEHSGVITSQGIKPSLKIGFEGMYGSGKTETAMITAKKATEYGMTAIIVKPGVDDRISDIATAFRIAEMYAPALLVIEDWDKFFIDGKYTQADKSAITNLLEGADSKTHNVNVLWTTNDIASIPQEMMRAGRTDYTITFGPLDRGPVERMYQDVLGPQLRDDVDFDKVYEEVKDLGPSFIRATFDKARVYSIISNNGVPGQPLGTDDLIQAARVMKKQNDRFANARVVEHKEVTYDSLMKRHVAEQVSSVLNAVTIDPGNHDWELSINTEQVQAGIR